MATIVLEIHQSNIGAPIHGKPGTPKPVNLTATVSASPGRYYYTTIAGKARTFERVGKDSNGNDIYRDQNRR